ncbi:MAG: succinate dehydrogenase cytochrome b subunit [Candidatus Omnitrophota bacterium]
MLVLASITKKQIVAATGLFLVLFVLGHLTGNFFIYGGSEAYNGYAHHLNSLRPVLNVVEAGLFLIFLLHMSLTISLLIENIQARGFRRYAVDRPVGERSWASRLIPFTGTYILGFVIFHLFDFAFVSHFGARSLINGIDRGLYGAVYNAFKDIRHSAAYIIAVSFLGFHLAHGVQSLIQTFGFENPVWSPRIRVLSVWIGGLVALAYSSIPLFILLYVKS